MSSPDMILMREMRGSAGVPRDLHDLAQHAVDAVADDHPALDRLDVDVAGPAGDAVGEHHVHQPDDRPLAGLLRAGGAPPRPP